MKDEEPVDDRQRKVPGYTPEVYANATITLIGAGGLGGQIGQALVRKGVGLLRIVDMDVVSPSNLSRQFFYEQDLNKPKAHRLARNLAKEGFLGTTIHGYALSFQDALSLGIDLTGTTIGVCAVDNNPARIAASRYFRERQIPCIFTAVSEDTMHGYVFLQQPGGACFGCQFPKAVNDETYPCGTPAVIDILKVVAGIVSYAIDSLLLMERPRSWVYKTVHLCGFPGKDWLVKKRDDCKLCGLLSSNEPPAGCFVNNTTQAEGE
jgi:molybdopterin/thiamine biosynthesis adenylyltransferase